MKKSSKETNIITEAYETGIKRGKELGKPKVTKQDIFEIIQATIDCKDIDTLIQRYTTIFKELNIEVEK